jgi:hypothetical protein
MTVIPVDLGRSHTVTHIGEMSLMK